MKKLTAKSPYARISVAEEDVDDEHTNGNGHGGPHTASPTITRAHLGNGTHAIADDALTLEVDGMMCGHCVSTVHAALVGVPGVASADVDLDGGRATVRAARRRRRRSSPRATRRATRRGSRAAARSCSPSTT